jgi:hypothetical protein
VDDREDRDADDDQRRDHDQDAVDQITEHISGAPHRGAACASFETRPLGAPQDENFS